jgi:periplasmic protein TonB
MEINKILTADILDIIFDGKNKQYGAYELRKTYNSRLTKAIIITVSLVLLALFGTILSDFIAKNSKVEIEVLDTQMAEVKKNDTPPPPPPPPPPKPPPPPEINQVKFTPPKIVKDEEVKEDEKIQEIKEDQVISTKTVESDNKNQIVAPVEDKGTQVVEAPKQNDEDKIFTKVENEAQFPGGQAAWVRYLQKNLNANTPVDHGAPSGTYQVIVKFIVSKDGTISDVQAESKHGFGMEDEAVKIIKRGPKWSPALQNGRNVNAYRRQPITFVVEEQ